MGGSPPLRGAVSRAGTPWSNCRAWSRPCCLLQYRARSAQRMSSLASAAELESQIPGEAVMSGAESGILMPLS